MSQAIVDIQSLTVRYGRSTVLTEISLQIGEGEVVALLGRNGAGKSSLVRCLLGQQKPTAGRVELFGQASWRHRARLMPRLGVVPEEPDAPPEMSARQLAKFCSSLYPSWDGAGFEQRLERFSVPMKSAFGKLSRGQKAQVMLALALAPEPRLLVLDDPTLGLDAVARKVVFEELVLDLADRGTTVFLTSHDLPGIEGLASRVSILGQGELQLDEELEGLKARFRRIFVDCSSEANDAPSDTSGAGGNGARQLLAAMEPVSCHRRGRGEECLVAKFDAAAFGQLQQQFGANRVTASGATLEEILLAATSDGETG